MELTRDNVLWFAGLFEGEGYFRFCPEGRRSMGIAIKMTDRDVLEKVLEKFGGWLWDGQQMREPHHKQAHEWHLDKRDKAYALLATIYPFLGARRQAQVEKWVGQYKRLTPVPSTKFKPQDLPHGTLGNYVKGCRCPQCTAANTAACAKYRKARESRSTALR